MVAREFKTKSVFVLIWRSHSDVFVAAIGQGPVFFQGDESLFDFQVDGGANPSPSEVISGGSLILCPYLMGQLFPDLCPVK